MNALSFIVVVSVCALIELLAWRAVRRAEREARGWRKAYTELLEANAKRGK